MKGSAIVIGVDRPVSFATTVPCQCLTRVSEQCGGAERLEGCRKDWRRNKVCAECVGSLSWYTFQTNEGE
jgi:hypothetical protein